MLLKPNFGALPLPIFGLLFLFKYGFSDPSTCDEKKSDRKCLVHADLGKCCLHIRNDPRWPKKDCKNDDVFYDCPSGNTILRHKCQSLSYGPRKFNESSSTCVARPVRETEAEYYMEFRRYKRQTGSNAAGSSCRFNTDCLGGMYCNSGLCTCLSNYVQEGSYCYEKINPSQTGCIFGSQCSAVWPGATCTNGQCVCPTSAPRAVETRDGFVCIRNVDECPLPALYGSKSILNYAATGTAATCTYGSTTAVCMSAVTGGFSVAELYDCIQGSTTGVGVCCPNRAFACSQKLENGADGGTTGTTVSRWYYNPLTQTCSSFTFYVSGSGNSNNFETQAACLSYCQDSCERGPTQYQTFNTVYYQSKQISCQSGGTTCNSNYQCTIIGSRSVCCSTATFICSRQGGVTTSSSTVTTPYNPGYTTQNALGVNMAAETRYYYDENQRQCLTFSYLGTGGNYNNFRSRQECENFCAQTVCERGSPLLQTNGQNQACSSSSQCPSTHTCSNSVCCPSKQTTCSQDLQRGTACSTTSFGTRYWYNPTTRQCESFTFGGCNGNDNNFDTQLACQQYCSNAVAQPICQQGSAYKDNFGNFYQCSSTGIQTNCPVNYECYNDGSRFGCCPTKAYTCALPSAQGRSCGPQTSRWYYDTTTQSCSTFLYNGCDGNSNNFANRELCQNYCGTGACANNGSPYLESTGSPRVCSSSITCPNNYECTNVVLNSVSQVNYCCPTRASICSLPPVSGNNCGSGSTTRYYFRTSGNTRSCTTFTFNGCGGNGNNFATLAECTNFCNSAACSAGESVYVNPGTSSSLTCNTNIASTCPAGYTCRFDSVTRNNVCCGSTDGGVCPNGERAYIDSSSQSARTCTPSASRPCPGTYLCRLSTTANRYYCCAPSSTTQCPNGFATYISPINNQPQVCTLGFGGGTFSNTCVSGYSCQTRVIGSFQGYCCSTSPLCPSGFSVYQTTTGRPQTCSFGGPNACPAGFQCQTGNNGAFTGYCCSATVIQNACPTSAPYLLNNSPVVCNSQSPTSQCPSGYSCQRNSATNTFFCCAGSGGSGLCTSGSPFLENNVARTCTPDFASCPANYNCQRSTTGSAYYCCSGTSSSVCGTAAIPYQPGGVPVSCDVNDNRCPAAYNCQLYSATNTYYCCQPLAAVCPNGGQPSVINGIPQTCQIGGFNTCPANYICTADSRTPNTFYCCSSGGTTGSCPNGGIQTSQTCSPNIPSSCISGTCQFIAATNRYQCCQNALNTQCPNGGTTNGVACSPNLSNCGFGANCQLIPSTNRYECCTGVATQPTCPNGGITNGVACSPNLSNCGFGATCQLIASTNRYECCTGAATQATCPNGGQTTGQTCSPNIGNSCGFSSTCQRIAQSGRYECCSNSQVSGTCPQGGTLTANTCSPNVPNGCIGGTCQLIAATGRYQCCQGGVSLAPTNCPDGSLAYVDTARQQVQTCILNVITSCPNTYTCTAVGTSSVCCQTQTSVQPPVGNTPQCPSGRAPFTSSFNNRVQFCTPGTASNCPAGYRCTLGVGVNQFTAGQTYLCCSGGGTTVTTPGNLCSSGNAYLYPGNNQPLICTQFRSGCPAGYTCQPSATLSGQFYCCGGTGSTNTNPNTGFSSTSSGCPAGGRALISSFGGRPQRCLPSSNGFSNNCPAGYSCQYSFTSFQYQCCSSVQFSEGKEVAGSEVARSETAKKKNGEGSRFESGSSAAGLGTTERPKKVCTRGPCKAGEYGCKTRNDCEGYLMCEDQRCVCPSNMMISEGRCVKHCGLKYYNDKGECMLASPRILTQPFGDTDNTTNSKSMTSSQRTLDIACFNSSAEACVEKRAYCNTNLEKCQCYPTYEARNNLCVLAPQYRKNKTKPVDDLRS